MKSATATSSRSLSSPTAAAAASAGLSLSAASSGFLSPAGIPSGDLARQDDGNFPRDFVLVAVRYAVTCGKSILQAAKDMNISDKTLGGWIRKTQPSAAGEIDVARFDELSQLRAEKRDWLAEKIRLTNERDFLKKAACYFANPSLLNRKGSK